MSTHPDLDSPSRFWRFYLGILSFALVWAFVATLQVMAAQPIYQRSVKLFAAIFLLIFALLALHALTWTSLRTWAQTLLNPVSNWLLAHRVWGVFLAILPMVVFPWVLLTSREYAPFMAAAPIRILWLMGVAGLSGWLLHFSIEIPAWRTFSVVGMGLAVVWQLLYLFTYPRDYPLGLNWSETSWYYYASFFFDWKIYGVDMPWPFLDIGRPLLLSPVFLLPQPSLVTIRLWQFFLWIGLAALVSFLLWRRVRTRGLTWLFLLWAFLWMLLGPVYYHLSLAIAMVLWGFNRQRFCRSLLWVGLASLWAGILRFNWIPVPAMLGLTLYLLETPLRDREPVLRYLWRPFWLGATGLSAGIASFIAYLNLSGRTDTRIASKFSADFLWFRLWPNATLSTGIILGALLVSAALLGILYFSWRKLRFHPMRLGLLIAMLLILFAGGAFASLKIGGGDNLHNLDAYLSMLMIWGAYALTDRVQSEKTESGFRPSRALLVLAFLTVAAWEMVSTPALAPRHTEAVQNELNQLNEIVRSVSQDGEPVLFIHARHLLTFGLIEPVPLVTEYELEELTEISISNNAIEAALFQEKLRQKQFGLIVMDIESGALQDVDKPFAAENNAWMETVYFRLQGSYESALTLPESGLEVYAPKP